MLIKKVVTEWDRNFKLELLSNPNAHRRCPLSNAWSPNFVLYRNVFAFNPKPGNCLFWFKHEFVTTTIQKYFRTSI